MKRPEGSTSKLVRVMLNKRLYKYSNIGIGMCQSLIQNATVLCSQICLAIYIIILSNYVDEQKWKRNIWLWQNIVFCNENFTKPSFYRWEPSAYPGVTSGCSSTFPPMLCQKKLSDSEKMCFFEIRIDRHPWPWECSAPDALAEVSSRVPRRFEDNNCLLSFKFCCWLVLTQDITQQGCCRLFLTSTHPNLNLPSRL